MEINRVPVIRYCQVLSVDDPTGGDRIKVALFPEDNDKINQYGQIDIDNIDFCLPLLPSMLHVHPKVGEGCLVLTAIANDGNSQRYYIGPVISQPHRMEYDPFFMGGDSQYRGAWKKPDANPKEGINKEGIFPDNDDISIEGRAKCGIQIKDDDIRIKAGVKLPNEANPRDISFNSKNPAYIKMKYGDKEIEGNQSSTTVVSDKINLLGYDSRFITNGLTDTKELITDEKLSEIYQKAQRLPYGDELVEFLKVFTDAFLSHTHNYIGLPPNPASTKQLISESDRLLNREELLSNTVRIN